MNKNLPKPHQNLSQSSPIGRLQFSTRWDYSAAPESRDHVKIAPRYDLFINGKFVAASGGKYFKTINPSNEEILSEIALAQKKDVETAVQAASRAFKTTWSRISPRERGKYLFRISRILQERSRELAVLETLNGGKPIRESKSIDIPLAAAHFFYYAGWADKLEYAVSGKNKKVPHGVAGQIIPWNFPLLMAAWKIAPALAAGNTVVLKPAETTPLTAIKLAEICQEAELPDGVVNIIHGPGSTGSALIESPGIHKIAFTGSTEVGKLIQRMTAGSPKSLTLELGGKSAQIVFEDAAIDQAVEGITDGIFLNQGHICCAGSRLLIQESIYEIFLRKLKDRMEVLRLGDPLDKNTDIGAIHSKVQLEKIKRYVKSGVQEGAQCYQNSCTLPKKGFWFLPTLLADCSQSFQAVQEEIFGPVLSIQTFRTPEEAIEKANNTPYGLAGGVWTEKGSKIFQTTRQIRAGVLWANTYQKFDPASPFGGYKESGMGREGGIHGLEPYLREL